MNNVMNLYEDHDPSIDIIKEEIKVVIEKHYSGEHSQAVVIGLLEILKNDIIEGRWQSMNIQGKIK